MSRISATSWSPRIGTRHLDLVPSIATVQHEGASNCEHLQKVAVERLSVPLPGRCDNLIVLGEPGDDMMLHESDLELNCLRELYGCLGQGIVPLQQACMSLRAASLAKEQLSSNLLILVLLVSPTKPNPRLGLFEKLQLPIWLCLPCSCWEG